MQSAFTIRCAVLMVVGVLSLVGVARAQDRSRTGILLLAHGGGAAWNQRVTELAQRLDERQPIEVAFGMATRAAMQGAVERLTARGVTAIVAVPLFVSSHSSVIAATQYLLGQRADAPADLALFATMDHGGAAHGEHARHGAVDGTRPVTSTVPIRMTGALDHHPIVAQILASRARSISRDPAREAVIIVAHGPTRDDENERWLEDMRLLGEQVSREIAFRSVDQITVRDDAPAPIRNKAAAELRALVSLRAGETDRVLVVPLLMSFSGIEGGIRTRLDGLTYVMADQGLAPDDRLADWVLQMAGDAPGH